MAAVLVHTCSNRASSMYVRAGSHHGARWKGRVEATMDLGYPGHAWARRSRYKYLYAAPAGDGHPSSGWLYHVRACQCVCLLHPECLSTMLGSRKQLQVMDSGTRLHASAANAMVPQRRERWRFRVWNGRG